MAKLKIYHVFAAALVLIRPRRRKRKKKIKKKGEDVSESDLYLRIEQLAVLIKA